MPRFTTEEMKQKRADCLRMRAEGFTHSQIANTLNVSRGSVNEWLNGNQQPRSRGAVFTDKETLARQANALRNNGVSFVGIANRLGISASTARRLTAKDASFAMA